MHQKLLDKLKRDDEPIVIGKDQLLELESFVFLAWRTTSSTLTFESKFHLFLSTYLFYFKEDTFDLS